jgi:hypothetical protein
VKKKATVPSKANSLPEKKASGISDADHLRYATFALVGIVVLFAIILLGSMYAPSTTSGRASQVISDGSGGGNGGGTVVPIPAVTPPTNPGVITPTPATTRAIRLYCKDSDGGLTYAVKGIVTTQGGSKTDRCGNENLLYEYYCKSTTAAVTQKECPCKDGMCVNVADPIPSTSQPIDGERPQPINTCIDSDNGKNYYLKGVVSDAVQSNRYDSCMTDKRLLELSCVNNRIASEYFTCPTSCVNGACTQDVVVVPPTTVDSCTDSDGKDIYTQGTVYGTNSYGESFKMIDNCQNTETVIEYLCDGQNPVENSYTCSVGTVCYNGACIKKEVIPPSTGNSCIWSTDPDNCGANGDGFKCVYKLDQVTQTYLTSDDTSCSGQPQLTTSSVQFQLCDNGHILLSSCGTYTAGAEPAHGDSKNTRTELGGLCCK